MDGELHAYAHDVVFQSWLPTQYDMKIEVKPLHRSKIVFSPDAMKNLVEVFAGDALEQIPGVADWAAFGWPSRIFGGYDIQYAGFSVYSSEGMILLETLDPPEIVEKTAHHYMLYGPRFKIPLNSSHYPLVLDATAMGNFVRQLSKQLGEIAQRKQQQKATEKSEQPKQEEDKSHEPTHEQDEDCIPSL
jgi:hypothetical protein